MKRLPFLLTALFILLLAAPGALKAQGENDKVWDNLDSLKHTRDMYMTEYEPIPDTSRIVKDPVGGAPDPDPFGTKDLPGGTPIKADPVKGSPKVIEDAPTDDLPLEDPDGRDKVGKDKVPPANNKLSKAEFKEVKQEKFMSRRERAHQRVMERMTKKNKTEDTQ
jgi:hypothetical protein